MKRKAVNYIIHSKHFHMIYRNPSLVLGNLFIINCFKITYKFLTYVNILYTIINYISSSARRIYVCNLLCYYILGVLQNNKFRTGVGETAVQPIVAAYAQNTPPYYNGSSSGSSSNSSRYIVYACDKY